MKKQLSGFVLGLGLLSPFLGISQEGRIQPCNTYAAMEEHFAADPQAKINYEATQRLIQMNYENYNNSHSNARTTSLTQYTIPVVFHILHMGGAENVSDAACIAALAQINKDYAKQNPDTTQIFAPFQAGYINSGIKFMLAHKDPQGNCTSGIIHQYDARTNWNQANTSTNYSGLTWDPTKYLNVIIVKQIIPQGAVTGGGIIVGYTYVPGTWSTGASQDAVVYNFGYLSGLQARSMSHEFGHWLGLKHTFGNTNNPGVTCGSSSGGDGISDTPDTKGNFSTCPNSSTNTAYTCTSPNPSNSSDYYQNVQNIMDYSSCPLNFTTGQTNLMRSILAGSTNGRNNVVSANNLIATDVNGTAPCAPICDFMSVTDTYTVCSGGTLNMKDLSYNGTITNYQWTSNNAVIAASNASVTLMTFPVIGTTNVTLTVSNAQGTSTRTRQVTVIDGTPASGLPASESFEGGGLPANWQVMTGGTTGWQWTQNAAADGSASYFLDGQTLGANEQNSLIMPVMNLMASSDKTITFAYAYAKANSTQNDQLKIQGSKDCGGTWNDIIVLSSNTMQQNSGGIFASPYIPAPEEWVTFSITTLYAPWAQYINAPSVMVRFNFVEGSTPHGNNFYIDKVKIINSQGPTVGINALTKSMEMNVYPNPSSGEVSLSFKLDDATNVKIGVTDIYGRTVLPVVDGTMAPGQQVLSINKNNTLAAGIYFIDMSYNGTKVSRKLIIE